MSDHEKPIIIDCGTLNTKIGFAGNNHPEKEETQYLDDVPLAKYATAEGAMRHGIIQDFDKMNETWKQGIFGRLGLSVDSVADHPVLIAESPLAPKTHSEHLTQHFFESYSIPGFFIANQGILALYCSGRISGVVLEMGHSRSFVCPVFEGFALTHACERETFISGMEMTNYLQDILLDAEKNKQIQFLSVDQKEQKMTDDNSLVFSDRNMVNYVKHEVCFVSSSSFTSGSSAATTTTNTTAAAAAASSTGKTSSKSGEKKKDTGSNSAYEKNFTLPDGTIILMADTLRKKAAEMVFDPYTHRGKPIPGIAQTLYNCVQECEYELRKDLLSNIIISGGVSNMNGMQTRLKRELEQIAPASTMLNIALPSNAGKLRDESVWCGGSILAGLPQMKDLWIRKKDYNEYGPGIVWRKVFS